MASSAGTCTITEETFGTIKKIKFDFVAGSGASVNSIGSTTTTAVFNGNIRAMTTVGGAGGLAPSASWDITVKDQSSVDCLIGAGANRSATTEHTKEASMGAVANDTLTLGIANVGSSNAATVYLYIR
ncbi:MAG: hypothetical protein GY841_12510 [FCB group bacterium]|nr:hypothetical protein [FCB group bacterium]